MFNHQISFDGTFDPTVASPIVGTGTLTYEAAAPLGDGSYDWLSFTSLTLDFDVSGYVFDEGHLNSTAADVNIVLSGGAFYFTNDGPGGVGDGGAGGAADFFTGAQMLNMLPISTYSLLDFGSGSTLGSGTYGTPITTPEPGVGLLAGVSGLLLLRRRRK